EESIRKTVFYGAIAILLSILLISIYVIFKFRNLNKRLELDVTERTKELNDANQKLQKANEELEKLSVMDCLTGVYNRRGFGDLLQRYWKICSRERLPLAVIMIDIDNFKVFNDTYGHLAGDQSLRSVAQVIDNMVQRPGDFSARFGGEEFIVMLYNTTEEGAAVVAEKIRSQVEGLRIENEELSTFITVSLGAAAMTPNEDMEPCSLINAADQALYRAKKDGKNTVVRASALNSS
ncbi:MAG: diguanylate cyclase, partial [Clostridia bacterium]|nr:diguanylate cyclase [Clostridia bacterium]